MSNNEGKLFLECNIGHRWEFMGNSPESESMIIPNLLALKCPHCEEKGWKSKVAGDAQNAYVLASVEAWFQLFGKGDNLPITVSYDYYLNHYMVANEAYPDKFWNNGEDLLTVFEGKGMDGFGLPVHTIKLFSIVELLGMAEVGQNSYEALFENMTMLPYKDYINPENKNTFGTDAQRRVQLWYNGMHEKALQVKFDQSYWYAASEVARKGGKMWSIVLPPVLHWHKSEPKAEASAS